MRTARYVLIAAASAAFCGSHCALGYAQEPMVQMAGPPSDEPATVDGCQVIARIDGQVVLACEVLWQVNRMLEQNKDKIPPDKMEAVREQLMKRQLASMIDTKLLYAEFMRNFPAENLPRIEENLAKPFDDQEVPRLMRQLNVESQRGLEKELSRLGSSLADTRQSFNEKAIAGEWVRSKIKINEEVSPDEMIKYYREHLTDYDFPAKVRWEELMVRKARFDNAQRAYAELAQLGNEAHRRVAANPAATQPVFADLAKAKSDGINAKKGGLYDWTTKGALRIAVVNEALFALPVGQMSTILESDTGFHIVRVLERKEAGREPFTEVQNNIRDKLKDERFRDAVDKYLTALHKDSRIWTVYTGNVSADTLLARPPGETKQR